MNPDLERAKSEVGIGDSDVDELARTASAQSRLVLVLLGVLAAAASFLVAVAWPSQQDDVSDGYPYASLTAAPLVSLGVRRRFVLALPAYVVIALVSFGFGALLNVNDAFFGFGVTYSVVDNSQLREHRL